MNRSSPFCSPLKLTWLNRKPVEIGRGGRKTWEIDCVDVWEVVMGRVISRVDVVRIDHSGGKC
jgi:hypothetical protein